MPEKTKKQRLILLDAHAIIHRAYHALPDFSNSSGEPTGALYGIATMLMKIVTDFKPDYVVACYDLPQKTFRHEAYQNYKAGRAKADENLVKQIISSRRIFDTLNIPIYDAPMIFWALSLKKQKKIKIWKLLLPRAIWIRSNLSTANASKYLH